MSLYNLIHGMNPDADSLLKIIGKSKGDFGRFRDVYVEKSKEVLTAYENPTKSKEIG